MLHRRPGILGVALLTCASLSISVVAQTERGPYARIAIMRAIDGHPVEWEEGYVRHIDWHKRVKDPFNWYSYTIWASGERQRWIIYATFGHAAASLSARSASRETTSTSSPRIFSTLTPSDVSLR